MALTPKMEAFCMAYIETGNASEAYRRSYSAENMSAAVIHNKASALLAKGEVRVMLEKLREPIVERHKITVDDLLRELEEARTAALTCETPQSAAAVGATMGKAKLLGYDKQLVEHSGTLHLQEMSDDELDRRIAQHVARGEG